ncbi:MAG: exodeoxyribonuclease V subunit beta [Beggiatoa sp. IS2]|nr:MAG: exodeoxyribonuclease V subunit beta [Beggiatoa sp. IS2]
MTTPLTPKHLDRLTAPLEGINLIEASAGTGKTYTLETLFVRLILEKKLPVNQILVVTFTEAATEELRDRIRQRLYQTLLIFQQNNSEDEKSGEFLKNYPDKEEGIKLLTNALRGFDEAAIFTIHGFCRRMLRDNAFESGLLFDTELVKDQTQLLQEVVEDFWRQHFYKFSPLFISYILESQKITPEKLLNIIGQGRYIGQPFLKIIPHSDQLSETTLIEQAFSQLFIQAKVDWEVEKEVIKQILLKDKWLNRNKYRETSIAKWCGELVDYFNLASASVNLPDNFKKFTTSHIITSVKKGGTAPQHPFFNRGEEFLKTYDQLSEQFNEKLLSLEITLFKVIEQTLIIKKYQRNIHSFDDLLINLYQALKKDKNNPSLAQRIRERYSVALIDEFQDTDQVQYEIFRMIYHYHEKNNTLFLIGDSKQAIYSFRGADIYTYIKADQDATHRYTLPYNWRSQPRLVQAINTLFTQVQQPFIPTGTPSSYPEISFYPVQVDPSAHQEEKFRLILKNQDHCPLQLWFVPEQEVGQPLSKEWAKKHIPIAVANEIKLLLTLGQKNQAIIREKNQDKPVEASDITVLVRTHNQAQLIQEILLKVGVPSVLYSRKSLFTSHEVMEIERLLQAIAEPHQENAVRIALTTDLLGLSALELYHLLESDHDWQKWLHRFHHYQFLWQNYGFIYMFRTLLTEQQVAQRLLNYLDGERRLTNVLHLAEVLQQTAVEQKLGIQGLCTWLSQQRLQQETQNEEQQLRLESDEKRVKIVTIHKSKGLEYPIVFCPFIWEGRSNRNASKNNPFTFHDDQQMLTLDLGAPQREQHHQQALIEEQAENLRLFYVAITRAKYRCYLIWGVFKDITTSPLAHLLHENLEKVEESVLRHKLQELVEKSAKTIRVSPLPLNSMDYQRPLSETVQLQARIFTGTIAQDWKISSFTALSTHHSGEMIERPDYDEITPTRLDLTQLSVSKKLSIFSFPGGAKVGILIHQLFEQIDFTAPLTDAEPLIESLLISNNYDIAWKPTFSKFIMDVVTTPLEPKRPTFTLSQINREMRLNELEFYYPMQGITPQGLENLFKRSNIPIKTVSFSTLRGFMRGFIDLIFQYEDKFYLVDYKSNLLGIQEAYHRNNLDWVMQQENYLLQYHIYVVALHRYLSLRLPNYRYEQHFGGVYYLFVRGMRPQWGANFGIYRNIPQIELINALSDYFKGKTNV